MSIVVKPCKSCGSINLYIKEKGGTHMIYCKDCNAYQCNIPKKDLDFATHTIEEWQCSSEVENRLANANNSRALTKTEMAYELVKDASKEDVKMLIQKLLELL